MPDPADPRAIAELEHVKRDLDVLIRHGDPITVSEDQALVFEYQACLKRAIVLRREIIRRGIWP